MADERRKHTRYALWFPVRVLAGDRPEALAVSRDASEVGIRISAATKIEVGERVTLAFSVPPNGAEQRVEGTILRMEPNTDDPNGLWPFRVTIGFDGPVPGLEELLKDGLERTKVD